MHMAISNMSLPSRTVSSTPRTSVECLLHGAAQVLGDSRSSDSESHIVPIRAPFTLALR